MLVLPRIVLLVVIQLVAISNVLLLLYGKTNVGFEPEERSQYMPYTGDENGPPTNSCTTVSSSRPDVHSNPSRPTCEKWAVVGTIGSEASAAANVDKLLNGVWVP